MSINAISTGEQSVTTTGAITGTLDTSAITGDFTICARIRGLAGNQKCRIAIEDTANASAFSEATQVCEFDIQGAEVVEGDTFKVRSYDIPSIRIGATNNKLRGNCQAITNGATVLVTLWLE